MMAKNLQNLSKYTLLMTLKTKPRPISLLCFLEMRCDIAKIAKALLFFL
jgi:hypothetical protein